MILAVRACIPLFAATPRTRQTHRTPGPWGCTRPPWRSTLLEQRQCSAASQPRPPHPNSAGFGTDPGREGLHRSSLTQYKG
jgi:hypothetical protein